MEYEELERAYQAAVEGANAPTCGTCSGSVLNDATGELRFDGEQMYFVDRSGIYIVREWGLEPIDDRK